MNIDIAFPKEGKASLWTIAPSLTAEQVALRNKDWYSPEAIFFADELLATDPDDRRGILDPDYDYVTIDADCAVEKYLPILINKKLYSKRELEAADAIIRLIVVIDEIVIKKDKNKLKELLISYGVSFD